MIRLVSLSQSHLRSHPLLVILVLTRRAFMYLFIVPSLPICKGPLYDTCLAATKVPAKWEKASRFPCVARIDSSRIALDGAACCLRWLWSICSRAECFGGRVYRHIYLDGATRKSSHGYFTCARGLSNYTGCGEGGQIL